MTEYKISITQGESLSLPITIKDELGTPIDLTSYTAKGEIRSKDDILILAFALDFTDRVNGVLTASLTKAQTESAEVDVYRYDIFIEKTTTTQKILGGHFDLKDAVTQDV